LADNHQILGPSHDCPYRGKSANDPQIYFARQNRSGPGGTGGDKDKLDVKPPVDELYTNDFLLKLFPKKS
jgi:hypothetical protein